MYCTWRRQSMDIRTILLRIQRYISLDSQENKSRFWLLNAIYLCISWRLLWVSINCLHHVEYIDIFQENKLRFWLSNDIYLCILSKIVWMSIDCLRNVQYIDSFLRPPSWILWSLVRHYIHYKICVRI
jgi:hypothetical protein